MINSLCAWTPNQYMEMNGDDDDKQNVQMLCVLIFVQRICYTQRFVIIAIDVDRSEVPRMTAVNSTYVSNRFLLLIFTI